MIGSIRENSGKTKENYCQVSYEGDRKKLALFTVCRRKTKSKI